MARVDLVGCRFGRLTVVRFHGVRGASSRHYHWECLCDCGGTKVVDAGHLNNGQVQSCGCLRREVTSARRTSHGATVNGRRKVEWTVWRSMLQRCDDTNCKSYPYYGGRGIAVCERWRAFENFLSDMGQRPSPGHSIDRIDVNGHYEPSNCRWATKKEQARNTRTNFMVPYRGRLMPLATACEEAGLNYSTVQSRRKLYGWSIERALSEGVSR